MHDLFSRLKSPSTKPQDSRSLPLPFPKPPSLLRFFTTAFYRIAWFCIRGHDNDAEMTREDPTVLRRRPLT